MADSKEWPNRELHIINQREEIDSLQAQLAERDNLLSRSLDLLRRYETVLDSRHAITLIRDLEAAVGKPVDEHTHDWMWPIERALLQAKLDEANRLLRRVQQSGRLMATTAVPMEGIVVCKALEGEIDLHLSGQPESKPDADFLEAIDRSKPSLLPQEKDTGCKCKACANGAEHGGREEQALEPKMRLMKPKRKNDPW